MIILFCLSVCQMIFLNFKGELTFEMKNLIEICLFSLPEIKMNKENKISIFTIFNQIADAKSS